jgi:hypothetical protein
MSAIEFVDNYDDLSTDRGYQFRFYCDRCGNGFMSAFAGSRAGKAGGFLRAASGLLGNVPGIGGVLGGVTDSAYEIQQQIGGPEHDRALREAVTQIKPLFNQCRRCGNWVCKEICWNAARGQCKECAPDLTEEVASAQAQVAREQAYERAAAVDQLKAMDMGRTVASQCPECGEATGGGKFCAECGANLSPASNCAGCGAEMPAKSKFCPECGHRAARS